MCNSSYPHSGRGVRVGYHVAVHTVVEYGDERVGLAAQTLHHSLVLEMSQHYY